jgi:hypothetical protein
MGISATYSLYSYMFLGLHFKGQKTVRCTWRTLAGHTPELTKYRCPEQGGWGPQTSPSTQCFTVESHVALLKYTSNKTCITFSAMKNADCIQYVL